MFKRLEILIVGILFLLAAWLRLGWLGVTTFSLDEAVISLSALNMAREGTLAKLGIVSSAGLPHFPATTWLFSIFYLFTTDPLIVTFWAGLLNWAALVALWALVRRQWGAWAGVAALVYMAFNPFAVFYARGLWSPTLMVPLAVLWLYAAERSRHRPAWVAATVFVAGLAFQVHPSGAVLMTVTLWLVWQGRWWRTARTALIIGMVLVGLAAVPYIAHIACCAPEVADQYRDLAQQPSTIDDVAFDNALRLGVGREWGFLVIGTATAPAWAQWLTGILLVLGGVTLVWRWPQERFLTPLVLLWGGGGVLLFTRHSTPVYIHYQVVAIPALVLVVASSTRLVKHPVWSITIVGLLVVVGIQHTRQITDSLSIIERENVAGGIPNPLKYTRAAAYSVSDDMPVVVFTHGDDPYTNGEVAVWSVLFWGDANRVVNGDSALILPNQPTSLFAEVPFIQAWEELEAANLTADSHALPRRADSAPFMVVAYDGQQDPQGFILLDDPIALTDGSQLVGWKVRRVGERMRVSTLWQVTSRPPDETWNQFHHLRLSASADVTEQPFAISDVPTSARYWQAGDRVIVMADFWVETGQTFWVDVGHYTYPALQRAARVDGQGDSVRLGPWTWE
ncbi:MAG: glycosyltransferase family 39 protein [Anaerolineales bacterium]|nr:glycosyltransferase family 39 protein [Anaerolineales bacterium]